jgi:hypothetical protein
MITATYLLIPDDKKPRSNSGRTGINPCCLLGEGFSVLEMMTVIDQEQ